LVENRDGNELMKILVTGTTGNIGSKLVPRLLAEGHEVTCIARHPQQLARFNWPKATILQADVLDLDSIRKAMPGIEVAYYLIHSMAGGKRHFIERDEKAAHNFGTAASEAGVKRIIYLGGLGQCEKSLSPHLDSRQKVGDILRLSGVPVTEFRAPIVIGSGSMSFEMIRYITERMPILFTPPWINTLCQPIAIENILEYLMSSLTEPLSIGDIFEIGGPDVLTYREIMLGYAAARKLNRPLLTLPFLTTSLLAFGADVITPLPTPYLQILIEGLRSEVMVNDPSARQVFTTRLIPYTEAIASSLIRDGSGEVERLWAGARQELQPGVDHKDTEGMFIEQRRTASPSSPAAVYGVIEKIGGKQGWYYANWLWQLRGWLDELVGGVGMRRGRSNLNGFDPGDIVDGWRVEAVQPGRLVRLWFEMKSPGPAWLQFEVQPRTGGGSLLILTAFFEPHGVAGLLYWYSLYPFHLIIFKHMSRAILELAEDKSHV
jgi:uncharacterized protein YbjT (DUF2867 family)